MRYKNPFFFLAAVLITALGVVVYVPEAFVFTLNPSLFPTYIVGAGLMAVGVWIFFRNLGNWSRISERRCRKLTLVEIDAQAEIGLEGTLKD